MITMHDRLVALAMSLRTSVASELFRRVSVAPDVRDLNPRDTERMASEYVLLADLGVALRLLAQVNHSSSTALAQGAVDFSLGALRDCGVVR